jgi:ketosteroid isomerase-like protein
MSGALAQARRRSVPGPGFALELTRRLRRLAILALPLAACTGADGRDMTDAERGAIADTLTGLMASAYDFTQPNVRERLLSLYPDSGRVVSAAAGRVTTERAELDSAIGTFWQYVGQNMVAPRWMWEDIEVDVLAADAAVVTASYTIPHHTPAGRPHTIAGAWTAVFAKRGGRWMIIQEHLSDVPVEPETTVSDSAEHQH